VDLMRTTHIISSVFSPSFNSTDMQAAPLWDPKSCQFVGILTVTDFIDVLRYYRETGSDVLTLASRSIADVLADEGILSTVLKKNPPRRYASSKEVSAGADQHSSFLSVDADASLDRACLLLHDQTMDFLPVMLPSDMRVLATITYTCVLEHLVSNFREQRRLFDDTIYDLGIGTYGEDVVVAYIHQSLHEVLHTMHLHGLSAVPVIDENTKKIMGVYSRSDITFLTKASDAEDAVSNLNLTLDVLMAQQRTDVTTPDALHTCSVRHTLQYVFEYFAQWKFNRLICVDEEERVVGVVSARDLVAYFL
jgi:5'-AMP-activated protein kinase regulatory gamma subunit